MKLGMVGLGRMGGNMTDVRLPRHRQARGIVHPTTTTTAVCASERALGVDPVPRGHLHRAVTKGPAQDHLAQLDVVAVVTSVSRPSGFAWTAM